MSLINKMLRDLESRQQDTAAPSSQRPVYQDLRPAARLRARTRAPLMVSLAAIVLGVGGFYAWDKWGRILTLAPTPVAADPMQPPLAARTPAFAAAPITPATTPVSTVPATPIMTGEVPAPVVTPVAATPAAPIAPVFETSAAMPGTTSKTDVAVTSPATENERKKENNVTAAAAAPAGPRKAVKPKPTAVAVAEEVRAEGSVDKRIRPFTPDEKAESAYRTAVRYLDQGRTDDAVRELTDALRAAPQHTRARELLVGLSLKNGHRREAQQLLEEGMVQSPKHHAFVQLLARIHIDQGADQKALTLLQGAAPFAPNDPDFATLLATVYQRVGRHADAVATFGQVTELRPGDARAWLGLAMSLEAEQKPEHARRAYERAQQLSGLPPALAKYAEKRLAMLRAE